jgi:hypothetical protein
MMKTITGENKRDVPKNKPTMVRLPSTIATSVIGRVGLTHASRPDFVLDAARHYLILVHAVEYEAYMSVKDKDVSYVAKCEFFQEYVGLKLRSVKDACNVLVERSSGKDTDVLLSVPRVLWDDVKDTSERLKFFSNHQDFLKQAVVMYGSGLDNSDSRTAEVRRFLEEDNDLTRLRGELDKLRNSLTATEG